MSGFECDGPLDCAGIDVSIPHGSTDDDVGCRIWRLDPEGGEALRQK